jgi:hypothetical protein
MANGTSLGFQISSGRLLIGGAAGAGGGLSDLGISWCGFGVPCQGLAGRLRGAPLWWDVAVLRRWRGLVSGGKFGCLQVLMCFERPAELAMAVGKEPSADGESDDSQDERLRCLGQGVVAGSDGVLVLF